MPFARKWLRKGGTRFPNAFATTPLCCPSRATVFTGRYAHNHGVLTNEDAAALGDHRSTFQRYLQEAGYKTALFGKFLNSWPLEENPPFWDRWAFFSAGQSDGANGYFDLTFNRQGKVQTIEGYVTSYLKRRAVRFIENAEQEDARPWLLYVAPFAPHAPAIPQDKYVGAPVGPWNGNPAVSEKDRSDKPPFVQRSDNELSDGRQTRRKQLRTLMSVDDMLSSIAKALREAHERSRTLTLFLSDNGFMWAEHGRKGKSVPYTASVRVPLFVRWPGGGVEAGGVDDRLAGTVDIAPTVLHAAGIAPEEPMDGRPLLDPSWVRDRILIEYWSGGPTPVPWDWASLRTTDAQYVEYYESLGPPAFLEYYDLVEDPWQLVNLLGDGDPTNDPSIAGLAAQLALDRQCAGTVAVNPCP